MQTASLTDAKNRLSELVERARAGERIRILVRGEPAADLVPARPVSNLGDDEHLAGLERRGIIRRGTGVVPLLLREPGPTVRGTPASDALVADRDESL